MNGICLPWISSDGSVPVKLIAGEGVPTSPYQKNLPCHKKNPDLGEKQVYYSNEIFVEQEDARTFKQDEEVSSSIAKFNVDHLNGLG